MCIRDRAAIDGLNGMQVQGRAVTVNIARPPEPRTGGSRFGGERRAY